MSYHSLSECTLTDDERVAEKNRIVKRIENLMENATNKEREFVGKMSDASFVSVRQLFWLRDLNGKF